MNLIIMYKKDWDIDELPHLRVELEIRYLKFFKKRLKTFKQIFKYLIKKFKHISIKDEEILQITSTTNILVETGIKYKGNFYYFRTSEYFYDGYLIVLLNNELKEQDYQNIVNKLFEKLTLNILNLEL